MPRSTLFALPTLAALLLSPASGVGQAHYTAPDHGTFTLVLQDHVSDDGLVDYSAIGKDTRFQRYIAMLERFTPLPEWSREERMAWWINAYNALTIRLVSDDLPVERITDLEEPFKREVVRVRGEAWSLDRIEREALMKGFGDPRVHFALVCASRSCPALPREAFTADRLNEQLEAAGHRFLADPVRNRIASDRLELSMIFDWYRRDFTDGETLQQFVARHTDVDVRPDAEVLFLDYDWRLNGR